MLRFGCWRPGSRLRLSLWSWSVLRRRGLRLWTIGRLCPSRSGGSGCGLCPSRRSRSSCGLCSCWRSRSSCRLRSSWRSSGSSGRRWFSCRFHGSGGRRRRGTCRLGLRTHRLSRRRSTTGSRCGSRRDHRCDRLAYRNGLSRGNHRRAATIDRGKLLTIL